jgi:antirestriction protein
MNNPKVYVGTYGKYNNGSIAGEWVDLTDFKDKDSFIAHCLSIHSNEEDAELMFQDFECFPARYYGECEIHEDVWEYIRLINNGADQYALSQWLDIGYDMGNFEEGYIGKYDSEIKFTEDIVDEIGLLDSMPETLRYYFDYEAYSRDLFISDYYFSNGYVFRRI